MTEPDFQQVCVRLRRTDGELLAPVELRGRLVADAKAAGTNLTEVAIEILSKQYGVKFVPAGRRTDPSENQSVLNLRLPRDLYVAVAMAAARSYPKRSTPEEIIRTLCSYYALRVPSPPKLKRNRSRGPAAAAA